MKALDFGVEFVEMIDDLNLVLTQVDQGHPGVLATGRQLVDELLSPLENGEGVFWSCDCGFIYSHNDVLGSLAF